MFNTSQLGLPLLQPSQAQKHVTVNEALVRLDGLTHLTLQSISQTTPPALALDGESFGVPAGGVNEWDGHDGEIAIYSNGGWVFVAPKIGWRAWIADQGNSALFDGNSWNVSALRVSASGSTSVYKVIEFDHTITAGATSTSTVRIPQYATVMAVGSRVLSDITGALSHWDLGVPEHLNRYGNNMPLLQGNVNFGVTTKPLGYLVDTDLVLTANNGDFAGGQVRIAIHYILVTPPGI